MVNYDSYVVAIRENESQNNVLAYFLLLLFGQKSLVNISQVANGVFKEKFFVILDLVIHGLQLIEIGVNNFWDLSVLFNSGLDFLKKTKSLHQTVALEQKPGLNELQIDQKKRFVLHLYFYKVDQSRKIGFVHSLLNLVLKNLQNEIRIKLNIESFDNLYNQLLMNQIWLSLQQNFELLSQLTPVSCLEMLKQWPTC